MPYHRHHVGGTRVPAPGGGHYEWPHDGAVVEVDPETSAQLSRMEAFPEVGPTDPDVIALRDATDEEDDGVNPDGTNPDGGQGTSSGTPGAGSVVEAPHEGPDTAIGDPAAGLDTGTTTIGDDHATRAAAGDPAADVEGDAHQGDQSRPRRRSSSRSRTVRE